MKILIYLSLFMFCALQGYGQTNENEWLKELTKLQNENRKLIKDSTNLQIKIISSVSKIDSLKNVIKALNKEYSNYPDDKIRLDKEIVKLIEKIESLEKGRLKKENDSLKVQLSKLEQEAKRKDSTIFQAELNYKEIIDNHSKDLEAKKNEGMQTIRNQLIDFYNKPFEELVGITSLKTIQRDLKILENEAIQEKLKSLQIYHESKQALSEKYNETRVKEIVAQLNSLDKNKAIQNLTELLENYKYRSQFLQQALVDIIRVDLEEGERDNNKLIRPTKFVGIPGITKSETIPAVKDSTK